MSTSFRSAASAELASAALAGTEAKSDIRKHRNTLAIAFITGLRRSELIEAQQYHSGANSVTRKQANPYYHSPAPTSKHKRVIEPQEPHRPSAHPVQHPVQQRKGSGASARKRILIVSSTLHTGGAERIVACLARHLDRERFDVTVCYLKESGVVGEEIERHGTPLVP